MGMILQKIDDPRDHLERANRDELWNFAVENEITEILNDCDPFGSQPPADRMRNALRKRGIFKIPYRERVLGDYSGKDYSPNAITQSAPTSQPSIPEVNAQALLDQEWERAKQVKKVVEKPVTDMSMTELRHACKQRSIKMQRTDNKETLKAKLLTTDPYTGETVSDV